MWNLEKWYRGTYLQGRNRDTGVENGHVGKSSGKGWDDLGDSYPTLCEPLDYSPPSSSAHEIFQARILEWVAISFLQGIFLTQRSNPHLLCLLNCRWILHPLSHPGSPFCGDLGVLFLTRRGLWAQTTLRGHSLFGCPWPVLLRHLACPGVTSAFWIRDSPAPPDRKVHWEPICFANLLPSEALYIEIAQKNCCWVEFDLSLTQKQIQNKPILQSGQLICVCQTFPSSALKGWCPGNSLHFRQTRIAGHLVILSGTLKIYLNVVIPTRLRE